MPLQSLLPTVAASFLMCEPGRLLCKAQTYTSVERVDENMRVHVRWLGRGLHLPLSAGSTHPGPIFGARLLYDGYGGHDLRGAAELPM